MHVSSPKAASLGIGLCQVKIFYVSGLGSFFLSCPKMVAYQVIPFSESTQVDLQGDCMKIRCNACRPVSVAV